MKQFYSLAKKHPSNLLCLLPCAFSAWVNTLTQVICSYRLVKRSLSLMKLPTGKFIFV